MALCWALPAGFTNVAPYLYFVFLAGLLTDRANRDDLRCEKKYGSAWQEYRRLVPYKIIPVLTKRTTLPHQEVRLGCARRFFVFVSSSR